MIPEVLINYYARDKFCHAMTWAVIIDRYRKHKICYGKSLQARFYGIPLKPLGYLKEKVKDKLSARVRFPVFEFTDQVLEGYLQCFRSRRFEYVNGYTSSLVLFAKYLNSKGIVLKDVCTTLRISIATSEVLDDIDRELLKTSFGVPVVNEYGASKLDIVSFEDENFNWISMDENLYIEVLDEQGNLLLPGQVGRIIITSLYNHAMPFIRYDLGDIGSIADYKIGNNHILKSLQGRTNDIAILPSGKKSPGLTFYYISKSLLEGHCGIKEFIVKQLSPYHFYFEYIADQQLSEAQLNKVHKAMDQYLEPGLKATFERKDRIERNSAGKLKHFQYLVK